MTENIQKEENRKRVINALTIEDDTFSTAILRYYCDNFKDFTVNLYHTVTLEESIDFLEQNPDIQIIFLDYRVQSQITGLEIIQHIRAKNIRVPVICITGSGNELVAVRMMKAGASDYLVKGQLDSELLEKSIRESLNQYEEFVKSTSDRNRDQILRDMAIQASLNGVSLLDLEGNITYVNEYFLAMWGYEKNDEVLNRSVKDFFLDPAQLDTIMERIKKKKSWTGEARAKRKDGSEFTCDALFSLAKCEAQDAPRRIMCSFLDITKIKDAEKKREALYRGIMEVFALKAEEVGNIETAGHIRRIAAYTKLIAEKLRETDAFKYYIDDDYIKDLGYASMLHDVGKWRTPNEILLKPTDLSPAEWEIIKQHPRLGIEMLSPLLRNKGDDQYLKLVGSVVLYHHERWDGSGYPEKIQGESIPLSARIVALADVYDALTSVRSYRKRLTHEEACEILEKEKNSFDPRIFAVFKENDQAFKEIREKLD